MHRNRGNLHKRSLFRRLCGRKGNLCAFPLLKTIYLRSMSRLYIVTLFIYLICRGHHQNTRLYEAQAQIEIAGRNINNLRYADDITLRAENEEELNSLLMKVKEQNEKAGLKLNIQKTKIMAFDPIISQQIDEVKMETGTHFIF